MSRTQNSALNLITGIGSSLLTVVLNFITRSIFINVLGTSYLGIEGLFTNILSMLSLAELGFGTAIVFKLYRPIEENNYPRIRVLMKLYRQVYLCIGAIILVLGLCLIPFLPLLIKDYATLNALNLNPVLIFLIYLLSSASSYWFFAYKTSFVEANQKSYLLTVIGYAISIANSLSQILVLVFTKNFVLYILVQAFFSVIRNLVFALVCDKRYPYLKEKTSERITKTEFKEVIKDCSALLLYRTNYAVIGATDSIVTSAFLGLNAVGLYANYVSVKTSVRTLLYTFFTSIHASLGSLHTAGNVQWSRLMFRVINFIVIWIYGIGAIGLTLLLDEFIGELWLSSQYVVTSWTIHGQTIQTPIALLVGIEAFLAGQTFYCSSFRQAAGLFQQLKFRPVLSAIVNLIFSLLLVPRIGIAGCAISTIISMLTTDLIIDPIIIHKHVLKERPTKYFLRNLLYKLVVVAAGLLTWWACGFVSLSGVVGFILRGILCVLIPSGVICLCFFRSEEFHFLLNTAKDLLFKRGKPAAS